ncbi:MAG: rod shape-determining protein MreD [Candidatus Brocadiia bacterium]
MVLILFLLQVSVLHRVSAGAMRLDLFYLLAVYVALEAHYRQALMSAFLIGLLRDLGSATRMGTSAFLMTLGAAGLITLRHRLYREGFITDMVLVFLFSLFCGVSQAFGTALLGHYVNSQLLLELAVGQAAVTAVFTPLFFPIFSGCGIVQKDDRVLA